jgi:hypothetical protein
MAYYVKIAAKVMPGMVTKVEAKLGAFGRHTKKKIIKKWSREKTSCPNEEKLSKNEWDLRKEDLPLVNLSGERAEGV